MNAIKRLLQQKWFLCRVEGICSWDLFEQWHQMFNTLAVFYAIRVHRVVFTLPNENWERSDTWMESITIKTTNYFVCSATDGFKASNVMLWLNDNSVTPFPFSWVTQRRPSFVHIYFRNDWSLCISSVRKICVHSSAFITGYLVAVFSSLPLFSLC